jgi:hypothetical protein
MYSIRMMNSSISRQAPEEGGRGRVTRAVRLRDEVAYESDIPRMTLSLRDGGQPAIH